jgi:hypothetical protein
LTGKSAAKDVVESNVPSATVVDQMDALVFISRPVMQSSEKERNSRLKRRDGIRFAELAMSPRRHRRLEKRNQGRPQSLHAREEGGDPSRIRTCNPRSRKSLVRLRTLHSMKNLAPISSGVRELFWESAAGSHYPRILRPRRRSATPGPPAPPIFMKGAGNRWCEHI